MPDILANAKLFARRHRAQTIYQVAWFRCGGLMIGLFSRLIGRLFSLGARSATDDRASDAETKDAQRNPANWSDDSKTVRISRSASGRLSWPARDQNAQPESQSGRTQTAHIADEELTRLVTDEVIEKINADNHAQETLGRSGRMFNLDLSLPQRTSKSGEHAAQDDDMTRLVHADAGVEDPVVGWLVIVEGPGRGRSVEIGPGSNSIGRASSQKLCINFGDKQISRERHAALIYDPATKRFFLHNGDVRNLTYIDNEVVLSPVELKGGETITLGDTRLRFVPFCGPHFGWP